MFLKVQAPTFHTQNTLAVIPLAFTRLSAENGPPDSTTQLSGPLLHTWPMVDFHPKTRFSND